MKPKRRKRGAFSVPVTRRGEIVRHAKHVGAADTEDYWRWLVAWVWHNPTSKDQVGALMFASVRMGRGLGTSEIDEILDQAKTIRRRCSADAVAKFLGVTYKQRQQLGITTIGSIDVGRPARTCSANTAIAVARSTNGVSEAFDRWRRLFRARNHGRPKA